MGRTTVWVRPQGAHYKRPGEFVQVKLSAKELRRMQGAEAVLTVAVHAALSRLEHSLDARATCVEAIRTGGPVEKFEALNVALQALRDVNGEELNLVMAIGLAMNEAYPNGNAPPHNPSCDSVGQGCSCPLIHGYVPYVGQTQPQL